MYQQTLPWQANYDKSEIPPYTLPELLVAQDGTVIDSVELWEKLRRPELLQLFREVMYGAPPPRPDSVEYELLSEKADALDGAATRREVRLHFKMNNARSHYIDLIYYLPNAATAKVPVFVGLTFQGNQVISAESDIRFTGSGLLNNDETAYARGAQKRRFPLKYILSRNYAVAVASYNDIFPDQADGWERSIYKLFYSLSELKARPRNCSAIGAWSWGLSRMLDYLQQIPEIDGSRAAVFGHSRLGKTSLWTGAQDKRFGLVCVNDSGCGGAALSRRLYGETLYSMFNYNSFGKWWFTDSLEAKSLHPEQLPLDQHELLALVAPRALCVHSATKDIWADNECEYLSSYYAGAAFKLYGKKVLTSPVQPPPDTPTGSDVSYFLRTGDHDLLLADWQHYLDMADLVFK